MGQKAGITCVSRRIMHDFVNCSQVTECQSSKALRDHLVRPPYLLPVRVKEAAGGERDLSKVNQLFPVFQAPASFWLYDLYAIHFQLLGPLTA